MPSLGQRVKRDGSQTPLIRVGKKHLESKKVFSLLNKHDVGFWKGVIPMIGIWLEPSVTWGCLDVGIMSFIEF